MSRHGEENGEGRGNASGKWDGRGARSTDREDDGNADALSEWVHTLGVEALNTVFTAEAEALAGPKGKHYAERTHHQLSRRATELTFGGRRIQVARPWVR
jgi:hypothetical protein